MKIVKLSINLTRKIIVNIKVKFQIKKPLKKINPILNKLA